MDIAYFVALVVGTVSSASLSILLGTFSCNIIQYQNIMSYSHHLCKYPRGCVTADFMFLGTD